MGPLQLRSTPRAAQEEQRDQRDLMATELPPQRVTVIRPTRGWVPVNLREVWGYRELLYFLVWRDVKVRYKQTVLGVAWGIIQPLFMAILFSVIFGQLAGISADGAPYVLFAFVALLPWNLFAKGLSEGSTSLVSNERLVTKVFFPRLILPASAVVAGLVDFTIGFGVLVALMLYFGAVPTIAILALPLFVLVAVVAAMGIAFCLSAIDARFRDVRYTLPFLTQLWFFATPVVYPISLVPEAWRSLYALNPMVGVVEGFRWALLGATWTLDPALMVLSLTGVLGIFLVGLFYFARTERVFADTV